MKEEELKFILEQHKLWLNSYGKKGKRTDLSGADLSGTDLTYSDLRYANLRGCNLRYVDLSYSNISYADLRYADTSNTNLIVYHNGLWTAYIQSDFIRIGCRYHSVEDWMNFTDDEIKEMHSDALEYRIDNKDIIIAISNKLTE